VFAAALLTAASASVSDAADPPNVVILFADDLGYGDLECFGHPQFKTPHLNRMAAEGARLTQFYVPTPFCAPSRGTILTGRYPFRHGVWRNPTPDGGINDVGIPDAEVTLGEAFRAAGYATACIGKWHLGHLPQFYPVRHGFDEYLGILYSNDMRPVQLVQNEDVIEYPVFQATLTRRYTERAVDFITRNRSRPFFLYVPHAMPHKPLAASEEFYKKSGAGLYGDVLAELDWGIGQVLKTLVDLGLDDRTLVLFTSDNGPWFGGHTAGLRGMKGITWEGGLRVPGIVRWPGHIPPDQVVETPCATWDVFPTVLAAAGIPLPQDRTYDGVDLLPLLTRQQPLPERALLGMTSHNVLTIRKGPYKLHVKSPGPTRYQADASAWVDPRAPDGVTIIAPYEQYRPNVYPGLLTGDGPQAGMLFDVIADPGEQHNVADQHPEVVRALQAEFDRLVAEIPSELLKRP
jgi:uncharacterized sulfatase